MSTQDSEPPATTKPSRAPRSKSTTTWIKRTQQLVSQRTLGKAMIAVGIAGIIIGLTTAVVGQSMIRQVERSVDDSLRLTAEALSAVTDSIEVTESIVDDVRTGMSSIRTTLVSVGASVNSSTAALTKGRDFLGGSLPRSLEAVDAVLPQIESIAKSVDDTLELLDEAPFGPNYSPVEPFDRAIARLSTAMDPLPAELRALSTTFDQMSGTATAMADNITKLSRDVQVLGDQLDDVAILLDRYTNTANEAKRLAAASRDDLSQSATFTRWWLTLLGLVFALGQVVPIWLGAVLLANPDAGNTVITRTRSGPEPAPVSG